MMAEDTSKVLFAYDGKVRVKVNRHRNYYAIDDFKNNYWPYRTVYAPFISRAKAIIRYAINSNDSISIVCAHIGDDNVYKILIYDKRIEFLGVLPINITQLGSNKGVVSVYEVWVDSKTNLPYKLVRTTPANTMVEIISGIEIDNLNIDDFLIENYISTDLPLKTKNRVGKSKSLIGEVALNWFLNDTDNKLIALSDLNDKVIVLQFTSMFCGSCINSIPFMKQVRTDYASKGVEFVSIIMEDDVTKLNRYVKQKELNYKFLIITDEVSKNYNIELIPAFFILDKNRIIKNVFEGFKKG